PIQVLDHPKFQDIIDVASWAINGVKIPGHKATHTEIMHKACHLCILLSFF
ncbi:hypothetical protein BDR06DRAFT_871701, partial [Suillus hirtellus]